MNDTVASRQRIAPWLPRRFTLGSSRLVIIAAVALSLIVGVPFLYGSLTSDVPGGVVVFFFFFGAILGGLLGSTLDSGRTLVGRGTTRLPFLAVRDHAIESFGREGWTFGGETSERVWYSKRLDANFVLFAVLLFLGILPGLIYLAAARRTQRAEVHWGPKDGTTYVEITVSPKGYGGQRIANSLAQKLA